MRTETLHVFRVEDKPGDPARLVIGPIPHPGTRPLLFWHHIPPGTLGEAYNLARASCSCGYCSKMMAGIAHG